MDLHYRHHTQEKLETAAAVISAVLPDFEVNGTTKLKLVGLVFP